MAENSFDPTNTTQYPTFASKDAMLQAINDELAHLAPDVVRHLLWRISNTDTSGFADPTGTWDQ